VAVIVAGSLSGVSLNKIAPESGDRRLTSSVSMDSLPAHARHVELEDLASADLERDLSRLPTTKRLARVDQTTSCSVLSERHCEQPRPEPVIGVDRRLDLDGAWPRQYSAFVTLASISDVYTAMSRDRDD